MILEPFPNKFEVRFDNTGDIHKYKIAIIPPEGFAHGPEIAEINSWLKNKREYAFFLAAAPDMFTVLCLILKEWEQDHTLEAKGTLVARLSQYADLARKTYDKALGKGQEVKCEK